MSVGKWLFHVVPVRFLLRVLDRIASAVHRLGLSVSPDGGADVVVDGRERVILERCWRGRVACLLCGDGSRAEKLFLRSGCDVGRSGC